MLISTTTPLGHAVAAVIAGIRAVVAHHAARAGALTPLLVRIYWHLSRIATRLDRLAQHCQAGTPPPPRASRPAQSRPARPRDPLPAGHAWLFRFVQPTAQFTGQVQALLADPRTEALVQAAPQAGRLLRPLCRMFGFTPPDFLRLPPRPAAPRPSRAKPPKPPPATHGRPPQDRPLPGYVRAAARSWRRRTG